MLEECDILHYHDHIDRSISARADGPEILPISRVGSYATILCESLVNAAQNYNVILHGWGEAWALESSLPNTFEEHVVNIDVRLLVLVADTVDKHGEKILGGVE